MKLDGFLTDSYQTELNIDGFDYIADRELEKGGKNEGTSPHGYLLGSIAGCKIMVAKGYLTRNNHDFDRIEVQAESEIKGKPRAERMDIAVELTVHGAELSEKELSHLFRIVDQGCPMANVLTAGGENNVTTKIITK